MERKFLTDEKLKEIEDYIHAQDHRYEELPREKVSDVRDSVMVNDSIKVELGYGQEFKFYGGKAEDGDILEVNDMFGDGEVYRVYTIVAGDEERGWVLSAT